MQRYWLSTPAARPRRVRFIDDYRSYVINYNLGRDLVADWVARTGGDSEAGGGGHSARCSSSPMLPRDLTAGR